MKKLLACLFSVAALLAAPRVLAAADLGDPAAPLVIDEWVKGQPVDLAAGKGKKIFVVEFWATWCPPCRESIPHLTEMQKKFKDVTFVGVTDEKSAVVKKFVEKMGAKMDYVVAIDKEKKTGKGYMEAYGIGGIPHAFIIDKEGRVAWQGHPMAGLEKTLEQVIAGQYDMATAKKKARGEKLVQEFIELVSEGKDEAKADKLAQEIEALEKETGGLMEGQKFDAAEIRKSIKFGAAVGEYQQAVLEGKDAAEVDKLAKAAEALAPKDVNFAQFKQDLTAQSLFRQYLGAVSGEGDADKAADLRKKLAATETKNPELLNEFAWTLLTEKRIKQRDLPLALKLAKAANDASGGKEAGIVDTYARALFDNGQADEAIEQQKKAVTLAADPETRAELEKTLQRYQAKGK